MQRRGARSLGSRDRRERRLALLGVIAAASFACGAPSEVVEPAGVGPDLYAVDLAGDGVAVAVGARGRIQRSSNGGVAWDAVTSPVRTGLYDVSFATPGVGWIVGQDSVVLRTEDGGRSWLAQVHPRQAEGLPLLAVHALDARRAIAVGGWGLRIVTEDGGQTWRDLSLRVTESHPRFAWSSAADRERIRGGLAVYEDVALQDVACLALDTGDAHRCWWVGEFGTLQASDGLTGPSRTAFVDPGFPNATVRFAEAGEALSATGRAIVQEWAGELHADPGWRVVLGLGFASARPPTTPDAVEAALARADARLAAVEASLVEAGVAPERMRRERPIPWELGDATDVASAWDAWVSDRTGTRDAVTLRAAVEPMLFAIAFASPDDGMAVAAGGLVLETRDAGVSWRPTPRPSAQPLFAVAAVAGGMLTAGLGPDLHFRSAEETAWRRASGVPGFVRDLAVAADGRAALAVGEAGRTLRLQPSDWLPAGS